MKNLSIFIATLLFLALSSCSDDYLNAPENTAVISSRAVISENDGGSTTNPDLLTDWENVSEIVLNSSNGYGPLMCTPPWCDGTMSSLGERFRHDIKKVDGWLMLFHTFKKSNLDSEQNYMLFYNLFTGVIKVFYFSEGHESATNTQWYLGDPDGSTSPINLKMFDTPSYISLADNQESTNKSNSLAFSNNGAFGKYSSNRPTAVQRGWNGFEYQVSRYSTDLIPYDLGIQAFAETITGYTFEGCTTSSTSGTITSKTTIVNNSDNKYANSIAEFLGNEAQNFADSLIYGSSESVNSASRGAVGTFLIGLGGKIITDQLKKGLNALFGRTTTVTEINTISDVRLTTEGKIILSGKADSKRTSIVSPVIFNLHNLLNGSSKESNLAYSSTTKIGNLGVWTIKSKPKVWWNTTMPYNAPYENDGISPLEYNGYAQVPTVARYNVDVVFNPYITPYIKSHKVSVDFYNLIKPERAYPPSTFSPKVQYSDLIYQDDFKKLYKLRTEPSNVSILTDIAPELVNAETQLYFKWKLPTTYDVIAVVSVEMNIEYMGKKFTVTESRVYDTENFENATTTQYHRPPNSIIVNNNYSGWAYGISKDPGNEDVM